jgi:hypothetical protein
MVSTGVSPTILLFRKIRAPAGSEFICVTTGFEEQAPRYIVIEIRAISTSVFLIFFTTHSPFFTI